MPSVDDRMGLAERLLPDFSWRSLLSALDDSPAMVLIFAGPELVVAFQNRTSSARFGREVTGLRVTEALSVFPEYAPMVRHVFDSGETLRLSGSPLQLRAPRHAGVNGPAPDALIGLPDQPRAPRIEPGPAPQGGDSDDSGGLVLLDLLLTPLPGPDGVSRGVLVQGVDVTSRDLDAQQLRTATAINRASLELSRSLEIGQVAATITRLAAQVFSGWGLLDLWQADGTLRRVAVTHHDPAMQPLIEALKDLPRISGRPEGRPESYAARCARTGEVLAGQLEPAAVVTAASSAAHAELMGQLKPRWFVAVPVQIGPRRLGALSIVRPEGEAVFTPADRVVMEQFAERAAIALAHARDYDEQRQSALTLQRSLLSEPPQPPQGDERVALVVRYRAGGVGREVGGDWYDVISLDRGAVGVAVGDVEGHDLAAAALMAQVRAIVHSHAHSGLPPSRIAQEANAFVMQSPADRLVTLTYLQMFPGERLVSWVRAGHLPALVVGPDGGHRLLHGRGGLPLGVDTTAQWDEETVRLPAGALLAIFTDGLVETARRSFDDGAARLAELLAAQPGLDLDVLADQVLADLAAGDEPHDDVALVLLRLPGTATDPDFSVCRQLPAASSSAPVARRFAADVLRAWEVPDAAIETAELLVTELVSNATRHSDTAIELRISAEGGTLRLSVFDDSHRLPTLTDGELDETSGRGLQLVQLLAASWGVGTEDRGKVVWFELTPGDWPHGESGSPGDQDGPDSPPRRQSRV